MSTLTCQLRVSCGSLVPHFKKRETPNEFSLRRRKGNCSSMLRTLGGTRAKGGNCMRVFLLISAIAGVIAVWLVRFVKAMFASIP